MLFANRIFLSICDECVGLCVDAMKKRAEKHPHSLVNIVPKKGNTMDIRDMLEYMASPPTKTPTKKSKKDKLSDVVSKFVEMLKAGIRKKDKTDIVEMLRKLQDLPISSEHYCSFCHKLQSEVAILFVNSSFLGICDGCAGQCVDAMKKKERRARRLAPLKRLYGIIIKPLHQSKS